MSFRQRLVDVSFQLGSGNFAESGQNTVKLTGLRVSAQVVKAGGPSMGTAVLQVYGMTLSLMNQLSTLGMQIILVPRNVVTVEAGDTETGMTTVFQGTITGAWADFDSMPDTSFHVEAHTGLLEAVLKTPPTSFKGAVDVATILASLSTLMGRFFENNGVSVMLTNPYFYGSARNQAYAAARAANVNITLDDPLKLAVWPRGGSRGGQVPLLSPETGMVGYPAYTAQGIMVTTLFNPSVGFGGQVQIKSDLKPACGTWAVYKLDHDLESRVPNGKWFSRVYGYNPKFPPPVLQ